jgi:hypothetical protein
VAPTIATLARLGHLHTSSVEAAAAVLVVVAATAFWILRS